MTPTFAPKSTARPSSASQPRQSSRSQRASTRPRSISASRAPLARYTDRQGKPREVVVRRALAGSVLVVDRDSITLQDCRLVAHLCADEPPENAHLVCAKYIRDMRSRPIRCRELSESDEHTPPLADEHELANAPGDEGERVAIDAAGCHYRLEPVSMGMSIPALRWCRTSGRVTAMEVVSLRQAIAALESYEPVRSSTMKALIRHSDDASLSIAVLGAELTRVRESAIVLNRGLREAVLATLREDGMSMSEMAIRCGRVKRDSKGNESGETSWLARRLGLLAESGQGAPTPWVHTDVLALIARRGLGVSPHEVEVS